MAGELTVQKTELVQVAAQQGLDTLIQPLVREIHLLDTFISGTSFLSEKGPLEAARAGDKLQLCRENSKYDGNAILVLNEQGQKLGYIPRKDSLIFARLMDGGKLLSGRINAVTLREGWLLAAIGIYLVDF